MFKNVFPRNVRTNVFLVGRNQRHERGKVIILIRYVQMRPQRVGRRLYSTRGDYSGDAIVIMIMYNYD